MKSLEILVDMWSIKKTLYKVVGIQNINLISLKRIYEKENGFNYDVVVHSRLDVIWFNKIILNNKDETLFVSHWNKTLNDNKLGPFDKENVYQGYALHDWWFYGSSDTMDNLSKVYKHKYLLYFQNKRTWNAHRFPYLKAVNQNLILNLSISEGLTSNFIEDIYVMAGRMKRFSQNSV